MATLSRRLYFVNAPVDFACIGGLSLVLLGVLWATAGNSPSLLASQIALYLAWVINWPHFSATNYRLYRRRENLNEYPLTSFFLPVLVLMGVVASFLRPTEVAPFFIKIFLLWSPFHFSGQNVGITLLYARRAGVQFSSWERRAITFFIFSTFLAPTLSAETGLQGSEYYEILTPSFGVPLWVGKAAWAGLWGSLGLVGVLLSLRLVMGQARLPWFLLLPAATQFAWFILGSRVASFYYFVPLFHSLQYLLIAWAMQLSERRSGVRSVKSFFAGRETAWWVGVNLAGGAILFAGLPWLATFAGIPLPLATGVLIAGVQIHHFLVDGVIWKLRNPHVASPLMASVDDFLPKRRAA